MGLLLRKLLLDGVLQLPLGYKLLSSLSFCTLKIVFVVPCLDEGLADSIFEGQTTTNQCMLDDTPCSLLIEADVPPRLCGSCLRDLDLLEILLYSSELFEDWVFFGLDAIEP